MKKTNILKKLSLNKETIANLDSVKGGQPITGGSIMPERIGGCIIKTRDCNLSNACVSNACATNTCPPKTQVCHSIAQPYVRQCDVPLF